MYRNSSSAMQDFGGKLEFHLTSAWDSQQLLKLSPRINVAVIDTSVILGAHQLHGRFQHEGI